MTRRLSNYERRVLSMTMEQQSAEARRVAGELPPLPAKAIPPKHVRVDAIMKNNAWMRRWGIGLYAHMGPEAPREA